MIAFIQKKNTSLTFKNAVTGTVSSGMSSNGSMKVYEICWQMDFKRGPKEVEFGVVPQNLTNSNGWDG